MVCFTEINTRVWLLCFIHLSWNVIGWKNRIHQQLRFYPSNAMHFFGIFSRLQPLQPRQWSLLVQRFQHHLPTSHQPRLNINRTILFPSWRRRCFGRDNRRIFSTAATCLCQSASKQSSKPLQFYAREGGACVFWSGVALWITFFPATQALSYFGGAQYFIDALSRYEYGEKFVGKARSAAGGAVTWMNKYISAGFITQDGIEIFILGFIVYFCLKPVRYPLWAVMTRQCMRWKQTHGIINKTLMDQHTAESKRKMVRRGVNLRRRAVEKKNAVKRRTSARYKHSMNKFNTQMGRKSVQRTVMKKGMTNGKLKPADGDSKVPPDN